MFNRFDSLCEIFDFIVDKNIVPHHNCHITNTMRTYVLRVYMYMYMSSVIIHTVNESNTAISSMH